MAFCEKCGEKLNDNAKFCHVCGATVQAESQTESQTELETESQTDFTTPSNKKRNFIIAGIVAAVLVLILIISSTNKTTNKSKGGSSDEPQSDTKSVKELFIPSMESYFGFPDKTTDSSDDEEVVVCVGNYYIAVGDLPAIEEYCNYIVESGKYELELNKTENSENDALVLYNTFLYTGDEEVSDLDSESPGCECLWVFVVENDADSLFVMFVYSRELEAGDDGSRSPYSVTDMSEENSDDNLEDFDDEDFDDEDYFDDDDDAGSTPAYKTAGDNAVPDFNAYLDNKCDVMSTKVADDHTEIIYMFEPNNKKIVNGFIDLLQTEYNFKLTKESERIEIYDYYFDYVGPGTGGTYNVNEDEQCSLFVKAYCLVDENIELHIHYADGLEYDDYGDRTSYTVNDISGGSADSDQSGSSIDYESNRESYVPDCTFCRGSGKCSNCGGDGRVWSLALDDEELNCRKCLASGRCSYCNGTGKRY